MANKTKQLKYNQAIDDISYLILHYPLELQQLLRVYGITFRDRPSHKALINETVELMKDDNSAFAKALAELISRLAGREDEFWGAVAKGAVGILGGLFKKKKRRSSGGNTNAAAAAAAQAAAAKRDMERRMQQMREEQRRRDEERRQAEAWHGSSDRSPGIIFSRTLAQISVGRRGVLAAGPICTPGHCPCRSGNGRGGPHCNPGRA